MKKLLVLITGLVMSVGIFAQQVNDPNAEVREAKNYHGISVSNAFDIYLSQSNDEAVAVSAATAKDRETITVEVKDGILYVGIAKGLKWTN
jgi:hypothetical protein